MPSKRSSTLDESACIAMTISLGADESSHDWDKLSDTTLEMRSSHRSHPTSANGTRVAKEIESQRLAKRKQSHQNRRRAATASHTELEKSNDPCSLNKMHGLKIRAQDIRKHAIPGRSSVAKAHSDDSNSFLHQWLPEYQKQLQLLEEQNNQKSSTAPRSADLSPKDGGTSNRDSTIESPSLSPLPPSSRIDCRTPLTKADDQALQEYERQLALLQKQNDARLIMIEQEEGRKDCSNERSPKSASLGKSNCGRWFQAAHASHVDFAPSLESNETIYPSIERDSSSSPVGSPRGLDDYDHTSLESSDAPENGRSQICHSTKTVSEESLAVIVDNFPEPVYLHIPPPNNQDLLELLKSADNTRPIPPCHMLPTGYIRQQRYSQVRTALIRQLHSRLNGNVPYSSIQAAEAHARALANEACRLWIEGARGN